MKPIRMRAGLPDFDDNTYNTYRNFKEVLKRERHIELFAENCFRYFDLRRWKDAEEEENQALRDVTSTLQRTTNQDRDSILQLQ